MKTNVEAFYPLSPLQQGMLFHTLEAPTSGVYFEQSRWTLEGPLDAAALRRAWQRVADRHPVLRTTFVWQGVKEPVQVVQRAVTVPFEAQDWRGLDPATQAKRLTEYLAADRARGFDLARGPLLRLALLCTGEERHVLVWSHHHLLLDGWSVPLLLAEVFAFYAAFAGGGDLDLPLPRPFRDYVLWLRQRDAAAAESFWRGALAGFAEPTDPGFAPAGSSQPSEIAERELVLGPQPTAALAGLARRLGVTPAAVVHGAWALLLARAAGRTDVLFGTTVSGRPPELEGAERMVGLFINTLPLRVTVPPDAPLGEWLHGLHRQQAELRQHEATPLVDVHGWSAVPRGRPLFETLLVFENVPAGRGGAAPAGLRIAEARTWERTNYPVTLVAALLPDGLGLRLAWDRGRLDGAAAGRLLARLGTLLEAFAGDPGRRLDELPDLAPAERHQVLREWSGTDSGTGEPGPLLAPLAAQAAARPRALAVADADGAVLSYAELEESANQLARHLREQGIGRGDLVGVLLPRSADLVVALCAVLRAGAAYLPLDPGYPAERLSWLLEDAQASLVVTRDELAGRLSGRARVVLLDGDAARIAAQPASPLPGEAGPGDLAYVIYTSGSTGRPKGAGVERGAFANLLHWYASEFGFGPDDRTLVISSPGFDLTQKNFFAPLLAGGTVVLGPEVYDPVALAGQIAAEGITRLNCTPSAFYPLLEAGDPARLAGLRSVFLGGEPIALPRLAAWRTAGRSEVVNTYGPTECTDVVAFHRLGDPAAAGAVSGQVPLGGPVPGARLLVVDPDLAPAGIGTPSQLAVGGLPVGSGYLGDAALTAARFVPDPFAAEPGARLYLTGDLARWSPAGDLEFLGRVDHQVKIRGVRIEPGEIEATLLGHPAVREAAVLVQGEGEEKRLVAFVAAEASPSGEPGTALAAELRSFLAGSLPRAMVPAAFVRLDALPLNAHGKVDRLALARLAAPADGAEPSERWRSPDEELLAGIWAEVLGVPRVTPSDSFFALGGHSLLAARVASRVRAVLGCELPLRRLLEAPTLRALAASLERVGPAATVPALVPVPRDPAGLPLSFAQERLWFLARLDPESPAYNLPAALRLTGDLRPALLGRALDAVVARHEALRTTFGERDGQPVQHIAPAGALPLPLIDLAALPGPVAAAAERDIARAEASRSFDLAAGPLLRARLLRHAGREHTVLLVLHHIVTDGWSMEVLAREVALGYAALAEDRPAPLPPLPVQYADYAAWQRRFLDGAVRETQLAYWRERLAGVPPLDLPVDRPRRSASRAPGGRVECPLPAGLGPRLVAFGARRGATPFMTLLAAFQALLARLAGQPDVAVGTPVANRPLAEIEPLVGFFVNTLVLRTDLSGDPAFGAALERVRAAALAAFAREDLPFELLVSDLAPQRDLGRTPLFQVMLSFQSHPAPRYEGAGLTLRPVAVELPAAKLDLTLELSLDGDVLGGALEYRADLFDRTTAVRLAERYARLLGAALDTPDLRLSDLPLLSAAERQQAIEWSDTAAALPGDSVQELIALQAARDPGALAVVMRGLSGDPAEVRLTYGELVAQARHQARRLRAQGVGPEARVALLLPRSPEMVIGLLAVLEAGGAYLPLDPAHPRERLTLLIEDAAPVAVLTVHALADRLPGSLDVPVLYLDLFAEHGDAAIDSHLPGPHDPAPHPDQLAYVLYTSGSTGRPKGVLVPHRGLSNYLAWSVHAYGLAPGAGAPVHSPLGFDLTVTSLLAPLAAGATVTLVGEEAGVEGLAEALVNEPDGFALVKLTPAHLEVLARLLPPERARGRARRLVVGGEALPEAALAFWAEHAPETRIVNEYGPTETVVGCVVQEARLGEGGEEKRLGGTVAIGRPIANTRLAILDFALQPVPAGVPGELCVGGAGVTRGYLGRPDLTAERFIPDSQAVLLGEPGARLYRTGDRVRALADGTLVFLGRVDRQVKIRGVRVEPGEVEAVLAGHPAVCEAAVAVYERASGDRVLAAGVVPAPDESAGDDLAAALRAHCREHLPEALVPAAIALFEALPLNAHGKVDRAMIAGRAASAASAGAAAGRPESAGSGAPRTAAEAALAGIWHELLGVSQASPEDGFFDLGGHSLLAVRLLSRIRADFGVELPLRRVFESPTLGGLAVAVAEVRRGAAGSAAPIVPVDRAALPRIPLSFSQERLWFLARLDPESPAYHVPAPVVLRGVLAPAALAAAFAALLGRHEALRTCFPAADGRPFQEVAPPPAIGARAAALPLVDLGACPEGARRGEAARLALEAALRPFDLAAGPLLRTALVRLAGEEHLLLLSLHHTVSDAWSAGILLRDLAAFYGAALGGRAVLPPLPVQYADYAVWQRGLDLAPGLAYWRTRLAGLPEALELPMDRPRSTAPRALGGAAELALPPALAAGVARLGRQGRATPFMVLLAAYQALLGRLSGQDDFAVGTPVAGRTRRELEDLAGFFVNSLVLRADLAGDPPFAALVERARETALAALEHQEVPFERLVEELDPVRDTGRNPLFQVALALQNTPPPAAALPGLTIAPYALAAAPAQFDLTLALAPAGEGMSGALAYRADLFDPATALRWADGFRVLLEAAAADPAARLSDLPLLSPAARHQLLAEWNATAAAFPAEALVHRLFEAQARRSPADPALSEDSAAGERLTFRQLDERANRLARHLAGLGAGAETPVGILLERSAGLLVAVLAVLKAGGAYVPLDPAAPPERTADLLAACGAGLLVTRAGLAAGLASGPGLAVPAVLLDADADAISRQSAAGPESAVLPGHLAYVLFTSGSTGAPKGVMVEHRALANHMLWMAGAYPLTPHDRLLQKTPVTFDASVWELFAPLLAGAELVLAAPEAHRSPAELAEALVRRGVTALQVVPTLLAALLAEPAFAGARTLRWLFCGGEPLAGDLAARALARLPQARLVNLYGPTETCIQVVTWEGRPGPRGVPLGRPIANVRTHVTARGALVPVGVPGELLLGGAALGRGYVGRPDLTAERYVPDSFGPPGGRLYRTGDLVRQTADGTLEYLRRLDDQVKVRGLRIEPGEIEAALRSDPAVRQAAVLVRQEATGARLVAYLEAAEPAADLAARLRAGLAGRLPEAMIPADFVVLAELPRTVSGKVDRRALARLAPPEPRAEEKLRAAPRTPLEEALAEIWAGVLRTGPVGIHDDFFALGGHSLLAAQLVSRVRDVLGVELPLRRLFEAPTVARLAVEVAAGGTSAAGASVPPVRRLPRDGRDLPLSFTQERLWFLDQLEPGSPAYNLPASALLRGDLDAGLLAAALGEVVRRHEALRTTFAAVAGRPRQVVAAPAAGPLPLPVIDLDALPSDPAQVELGRLAAAEAVAPFDLAAGPQLRARLVRLPGRAALGTVATGVDSLDSCDSCVGVELASTRAEASSAPTSQHGPAPATHALAGSAGILPAPFQRLGLQPAGSRRSQQALQNLRAVHRFADVVDPLAPLGRPEPAVHAVLFTLHHIVSDGWSIGVLLREAAALYGAFVAGRPSPLSELAVQVADHAAWQRARAAEPGFAAQVAAWRERLAGVPPLELPTARPRPASPSGRGGAAVRRLPAGLADRLGGLGRAHGATLFMTLFAGFQAVLARASGQVDFAVGTPTAGRGRGEVEGLIGCFLNTLVLRADLTGNPDFGTLLGRVRETALAAYAVQEVPFERLLEELRPERDVRRSPLFQVFFNLLDLSRTQAPVAAAPGLVFEPIASPDATAKFDLTLYAGVEDDGAIALRLVYDRDLFEAVQVEGLVAQMAVLLAAAVEEPGRRLADLPLVAVREGFARNVQVGWETVLTRFAHRTSEAPEGLAIETERGAWSYAELAGRADRVARGLAAFAAVPGDGIPARVGLLFGHGAPMVAGMLGALGAGAAYVPLDPALPGERLVEVLRDAAPVAVLADAAHRGLAGELVQGLPAGERPAVLSYDDLAAGAAPTAAPFDGLPSVPGERLAYLLYTSGSTGRPKGVMQSGRNLLAHAENYAASLGLGVSDRLSLVATYAFDAAVMDIYGALVAGAALCPRDVRDLSQGGSAGLAAWLAARRISVHHSTPTLFRELLRQVTGGEDWGALRAVVLGGEEVRPSDVELFAARFPNHVRLVNGLGPTESTLALQYHHERGASLPAGRVPVGRPVPGTEVLLLQELDGALAEQAMVYGTGEIAVRSPHVALGYWRRPEETAAAFRDEGGGVRLYRTGDLGRLLPDGSLEFAGRRDLQVKIRGHRIEPAEVESALAGHPGVRESVVVAREDGAGERRLVAYVVPAPDRRGTERLTAEALREHLRGRLSEVMIPAFFVFLEALPLTATGKVDRRALPEPPRGRPAGAAPVVPPRTAAERAVAEVWCQLLGLAEVSVHDDFFALGGHSLLAIQAASRLREVFAVELPLRELFDRTTVAALAAAIEAARSRGLEGPAAVPAVAASGAPAVPPPLVAVPRAGRRVTRADLAAGGLPQSPAVPAIPPVPAAGSINVPVGPLSRPSPSGPDARPVLTVPAARTVVGGTSGSAVPGEAEESGGGLDFSLFFFSADGSAAGSDKYRLLLESSRFADRHGFAAVWTPERHFDAFGGLYPNPALTSAALAGATERIALRAGSVVLPLQDPLRVAEEWAVVDNLSGGRAGLAFASGWHVNDFALAPDAYERRREAMWEGIAEFRRAWAGEPVRRRNGAGQEVELRVFPRPLQAEPPLWITCQSDETFVRAGELGLSVLTNMNYKSAADLEERIRRYRAARERAGHDPATGTVTLMLHTYVADDPDEVRLRLRTAYGGYLLSNLALQMRFAQGFGAAAELSPADREELMERAFQRLLDTNGLVGTPAACRAKAEGFRAAGVDEIACLIDFGLDLDTVLASLERVAQLRHETALALPGGRT